MEKGRVVVGVDGSDFSRRALQRGAHEARLRDATLYAVFVFPPPQRSLLETDRLPYSLTELPYSSDIGTAASPTEEPLQRARRQAQQNLATFVNESLRDVPHDPPRLVVIPDRHPAEALIEHADGADLLVIGTRGLGGFQAMLMGSVAQQCVQHARCAVLVLPPGM